MGFPIPYLVLRRLPARELKGLSDVSSAERSVNPDRADTPLVPHRFVWAFLEVSAVNREHSSILRYGRSYVHEILFHATA